MGIFLAYLFVDEEHVTFRPSAMPSQKTRMLLLLYILLLESYPPIDRKSKLLLLIIELSRS